MNAMNKQLSSSLRTLTCIAVMAAIGCAEVGHAGEAPTERRVIVFWDLTGSIADQERMNWMRDLEQLPAGMGTTLWQREEFDEIQAYPLHMNTYTSTPLIQQRFNGYELDRNVRRKQLAQFEAQLRAIDSLQLDPSVLGGTDVIGSVGRAIEILRGRRALDRELRFYSDMSHSMPGGVDFEVDPMPFGREDAADAAQRTVSERGWTADDLSGVEVHVRLPGTIQGAHGERDPEQLEAIRLYWVALFDAVGAEVVTWQR